MFHHMKFVAIALCMAVMLPQTGRTAPESFANLAEQLMPAVVNISTSQNVPERPNVPRNFPQGSPFDDMFRDFFERFGTPQDGAPRGGPGRKVQSLGSGFIIDRSGYVVTNNHVIEEADEIEVIMQDGTSLKAELVGRDPKTDIAVLKVTTDEDLPFVKFGDSNELRVGDWVLAIGNPFGLGGSVSAGIVSARHRRINAGPYDDFIQTDAAINRGNSGGPLFDMDGEVVGVNTAIISPSGGSVGIGFSIPSHLAKNVVDQLIEFGQTRRGWLGVRIQTVTDDIAESVGLDRARGALVAGIASDGPSAKSEMLEGDIIITFDGKAVEDMQDLPRIVAETTVGKRVDVEVWREGSPRTIQVTIDLLDENMDIASNNDAAPESTAVSENVLGMKLSNITPALRSEYGLSDEVQGVLVLEVDPDSQAAEKGIGEGDVIDKIFSDSITSPREASDAVEKVGAAGGTTALLRLNIDGQYRFVALRLR
ncbi:MAG TPA: serine protease [Alphaproteobacteria bacterium]|nr:MAG: DegQ family serine endoprotease [SAR116 cluster bacterium]HCY48289.1 serine protease [Alphaproteobacteria bacterium]|tara:strand:- start:3305 stop:4747 length:1443 start_codon:yes stop_codon:yes gene_type:complete